MVKNNKYFIFGFRVVVLFEDCCKKVELHMKYLKLQRTLAEKMFELRSLELQEKRIFKGMRKYVQTTVMLSALFVYAHLIDHYEKDRFTL